MDQVFVVRRCVKSIQRMGKIYFGRLWILERPMIRSIGTPCGRCLEYGVGGKLLKAVQVFHVNSRACVRELGNGCE